MEDLPDDPPRNKDVNLTDRAIEMADDRLFMEVIEYLKVCTAAWGAPLTAEEIVKHLRPLGDMIHRFAHSLTIDAMVARGKAPADTPVFSDIKEPTP